MRNSAYLEGANCTLLYLSGVVNMRSIMPANTQRLNIAFDICSRELQLHNDGMHIMSRAQGVIGFTGSSACVSESTLSIGMVFTLVRAGELFTMRPDSGFYSVVYGSSRRHRSVAMLRAGRGDRSWLCDRKEASRST